MIQKVYHTIMRGAEALPAKIAGIKITCAESWAIARKKQLYSSVSWTAEQQKQFDDFWLDAYGKKIPNNLFIHYTDALAIFALFRGTLR
ncbi:MAG: hypothetical protein Q3995_06930 [Eubacteriales bacterium]|nr:hypothetical protein [Eubacteriales bacterium]